MNIMRKSIKTVAAGAAMAFAIAIPAQSTVLEDIIKKAGDEGTVAINVSTTRFPAATGPGISKALADKFGVDIKVELVNNPPVPVTSGAIIKEFEAGVEPSFDVFPLPLSFTKRVGEAGAIEKIDWAGIGVDADLIDPNGNSVWVNTIARGVFYNTDLVKAEDAPTKLEDLLDPKWKGKLAGPGFGDAYGMISVPVLGEEKATEWLKALYDDQSLTVIRSMSEVPNRVANGEFSIGMGIPANHTKLVDKGAPLANAPLEKVGGQPYYMFVLKNAPNPNAGALLAYFFCCTQEGKDALYENMGWSKFDYPGSEQNAVGGDGRGMVPTQEWQLSDQGRIHGAFTKLIGR